MNPATFPCTHLSVGQSSSLLQRTGGILELLELFQLQETSGALSSLGLCGQIIALEELLVLGLEERVTGRGLGKDEKDHFFAGPSQARRTDGRGREGGSVANCRD